MARSTMVRPPGGRGGSGVAPGLGRRGRAQRWNRVHADFLSPAHGLAERHPGRGHRRGARGSRLVVARAAALADRSRLGRGRARRSPRRAVSLGLSRGPVRLQPSAARSHPEPGRGLSQMARGARGSGALRVPLRLHGRHALRPSDRRPDLAAGGLSVDRERPNAPGARGAVDAGGGGIARISSAFRLLAGERRDRRGDGGRRRRGGGGARACGPPRGGAGPGRTPGARRARARGVRGLVRGDRHDLLVSLGVRSVARAPRRRARALLAGAVLFLLLRDRVPRCHRGAA